MNICHCEHPVKVKLPNGTYSYVPCGKCVVCKNRLSEDWVHRCQRESECWKNTIFFTLSYDNAHLPFVVLTEDNRHLLDVSSGQVVPDLELTKEQAFYCRKMKRVSYVNVRDVQLFIKRLRYYYYDYKKSYGSQNRTLRYYISFEYGPTTHRVHLHGLLWFTDERNGFAKDIQDYIYKSWQNGIVDASPVQGSAASYVAKYCSSPIDSRSLYAHPFFRVRHLASKCPPIGSIQFNDKLCKSLFTSASPLVTVAFENHIDSVNYPLYLRNKIFPKIAGFSRFTDTELLGLYSISKWSGFETYDEFKQDLVKKIQNIFNPNHIYFKLFSLVDYSNKDPFNAVHNIWRVSKRVCIQADVFGVSVYRYVKQIFKYYQNVEFLKLKNWYIEQEKLYRQTPSVPVSCWVAIDPEFMELVCNYNWQEMDLKPFYVLASYGLDPVEFLHSPTLPHNPQLVSYLNKITGMYSDSKKLKAKKDYLYRHSNFKQTQEIYEKYF